MVNDMGCSDEDYSMLELLFARDSCIDGDNRGEKKENL